MRKIFLLIVASLLLAALTNSAKAQFATSSHSRIVWVYYAITGNLGVDMGAGTSANDSTVFSPSSASFRAGSKGLNKGTIINTPANHLSIPRPVMGMMAFDTTDKHYYGYDGLTWKRLDSIGSGGGSSFDTAYLYAVVLPSKQSKSDTTTYDATKYWVYQNFLEIADSSIYLTPSDAAAAYQPIGTYITPSDTAGMLAPYYRQVGFGLVASGHLVYADTTKLITNNDTLNKWLPVGYPLPTDYTPRLFLTTGSGVGTTYIDEDTASMSAYYRRVKDSLTKYVTPKQLHDSLAAYTPATPAFQSVITAGNTYTNGSNVTTIGNGVLSITDGTNTTTHSTNKVTVSNGTANTTYNPTNVSYFDGTNTGRYTYPTLTGTQVWTPPDASGNILLEDNTAPISNKALAMNSNTMTSVATGSTTDSFLVLKNNVVKKIAAVTGGSGDMLLGTAQTVTAAKSFDNNTLILKGSTSGTLTLRASATAGTGVMTFPTGTHTVATSAGAETFTNKTISGTVNTISNLPASSITSGVFSDSRLSSNVLVLNKQTLTTNNNSATTSYLGFGANTTTFKIVYTGISQANPNNTLHGEIHVYIDGTGNTHSFDIVAPTSTGSGISLGSVTYNDYSGTFTAISAGGVDVNWYLDILVYKN